MKIYTKGGDRGITSLLGGTRVPKNDPRIESYGTVDELISWIGLLRDQPVNANYSELLLSIQDKLMFLSSALADENNQLNALTDITEEDINKLESEMDKMEKYLPALDSFILPGGDTVVSWCHIARCVCRRAERRMVPLIQDNKDFLLAIKYINRLSDFLFMLCRKIAFDLNVEEIKWKPEL
ncbi:MAG: cob(I)yrinic acid a,c-diamide adenosyltransferase [Bacteroidales bacterium]|nr:cob(I)yrinic acid a,c-diamide adenosyltransferase [Bacteroidales bacterium]